MRNQKINGAQPEYQGERKNAWGDVNEVFHDQQFD